MGGSNPGQVALNFKKKQVEKALKYKPVRRVPF